MIEDLDGIQRKDLEWNYHDNTFDTKLERNVKRYRVVNDNRLSYHSIIPNNGERIVVLFRSVYRVKMDTKYDSDNNLNAKFQLKCDNLIQDLDGIQRKDLEWSIKKYRVNKVSKIFCKEWD